MKKFLSVILALVLIISLVACGKTSSSIPKGFDPNLYEYAVAAYELVRDYNRGKISADDAMKRANTIQDNTKAVTFAENKSGFSNDTYKTLNESKRANIVLFLSNFTLSLINGSSTDDIEKSLKSYIEP